MGVGITLDNGCRTYMYIEPIDACPNTHFYLINHNTCLYYIMLYSNNDNNHNMIRAILYPKARYSFLGNSFPFPCRLGKLYF